MYSMGVSVCESSCSRGRITGLPPSRADRADHLIHADSSKRCPFHLQGDGF